MSESSAKEGIEVIKEYCPSNNICVIRTNAYGSSMQFLTDLFDKAAADFPGLQKERVEIRHYGGIRDSGTFGIEFKASHTPPESYFRIRELEYTR